MRSIIHKSYQTSASSEFLLRNLPMFLQKEKYDPFFCLFFLLYIFIFENIKLISISMKAILHIIRWTAKSQNIHWPGYVTEYYRRFYGRKSTKAPSSIYPPSSVIESAGRVRANRNKRGYGLTDWFNRQFVSTNM